MDKHLQGQFARVEFDFDPSIADDLELRKGCMVKIIKSIDDFWYFGQNLHDNATGVCNG